MRTKFVVFNVFIVIFIITAVITVGLFLRSTSTANLRTSDKIFAATCNNQAFTITQPTGYTFTADCIQSGTPMYNGDPRFTFFNPSTEISGMSFIRPNNLVIKDSTTLNWAVTLNQLADVYIFTRKIPGQTAIPWIKSEYPTQVSPLDFSGTNLNQFMLRKNNDGLIGVYDIYKRSNVPANTTLPMKAASTATTQAYSMYIVGINPLSGNVTPAPTNPSQTLPPGNTQTLYVATTGNDSAQGTASAPFKTISRAISAAQAGTEIRVNPGTYNEKISLTGKNGAQNAPIVIIGNTDSPANYPVIQGAGPVVNIANSSWISLERLKIVTTSGDDIYVSASKYIVVRRNILKYVTHGVNLRDNSHHILMEYNNIYTFEFAPDTNPLQNKNIPSWTTLKGSTYEGGAYTSGGGAGMIVIRNNYVHDMFNAFYQSISGRTGDYHDANVWIYNNTIERIVDDSFEPESFAFNNHFFNNTMINAHRMLSLDTQVRGPVYVYNNTQLSNMDMTRESSSRPNSTIKMVNLNSPTDFVYFFNNSIDESPSVASAYGIHFLSSSIKNFQHYNNAYKVSLQVFSSAPSGTGNIFSNDIGNKPFPMSEPGGIPNTDPGFVNSLGNDFRLSGTSPALGKGRAVTVNKGFTSTTVIPAGENLGAYQGNTRHSVPSPKYEVPPGGEYSDFGPNLPFPADTRPGPNPPGVPN